MKKKTIDIIITISFVVILYGATLINIMRPDAAVSYSERRTLAQLPTYTKDKLLNGVLFEEYEKYFLDQFVLRDEFRSLKAYMKYNLLQQKDNNNIYVADGYINKMEYQLNDKAILNAANKLNEIKEKYLQDNKVYYAVIPDKNYFMAEEHGYLSMDYDRLLKLLEENVNDMSYIDIFNALEIEDYYKTDIHWSQDKITDIAAMLLEEMDGEVDSSKLQYTEKSLYPFYGSYYGQSALQMKADNLVYLTNDTIENAEVYDHIDQSNSKVYLTDKFGTIDSYDLFLSGPKSLITITNPAATTDKDLIIFRDSFGSSIAPLMLEGYAKITLVDLRYIQTNSLGDYLDFTQNQDVLFLYNTLILNNSYMFK